MAVVEHDVGIMDEILRTWSLWVTSGDYPDLQAWLVWYRNTPMPHDRNPGKTYEDFMQYDLGIESNPPASVDECWARANQVLDAFIVDLKSQDLDALFWHGLQGLLVRNISNLYLDQPISAEQYRTTQESSRYSVDNRLSDSASLDERYNELLSMTEYGKEILTRKDLPDLDYTLGVAIVKFHELFVAIQGA